MKIGSHRGIRATYQARNNQYLGHVFETITDEVYVLFVADETYAKRCHWLKQNQYELAKKVIL